MFAPRVISSKKQPALTRIKEMRKVKTPLQNTRKKRENKKKMGRVEEETRFKERVTGQRSVYKVMDYTKES